jgi:uncharacterized protein (DUF2267 family)
MPKFSQEGNVFLKNLAERLGHPGEVSRTGIVLRAVLHAMRDRITIGESLNLLSQLPVFLKAFYVEGWNFSDKPSGLNTMEDITPGVEKLLARCVHQFSWQNSSEEITRIILSELGNYVTLEYLVRESIHA